MRRLRLPKIGPPKTKGFFEEYLYALLGIVFVATTILGKAGGLSGFNAVVLGAWITAFLWFASQWKGYLAEKSKAANGKAVAAAAQPSTEAPEGPLPLPPGMKPMIGPQWPVKAGARPAWPKLPKQQPATTTQAPTPKPPAVQTPAIQVPSVQAPGFQAMAAEAPATPPDPNKKTFVYERPTLPDRKPKLPHNWTKPNKKKPKR